MSAQVNLLENLAARRVEENDVIREVVRDEQLVRSVGAGDNRKAGGIRQDRSFVGFLDALGHLFSCGNLLRRNLYKAIPTDLALMKAIDCDAVSGITRLLSRRVSNRTNRSVKVLTVGTEHQTGEIALMRILGQAVFWEIGKLVGL